MPLIQQKKLPKRNGPIEMERNVDELWARPLKIMTPIGPTKHGLGPMCSAHFCHHPHQINVKFPFCPSLSTHPH